MVLFTSIGNRNNNNMQKTLTIKTIEEEYVRCMINDKTKKWTKRKLEDELLSKKHDMICPRNCKYDPLKKNCFTSFSLLNEDEEYYTRKEIPKKRDYKIIFENLKSSPPIQIAFCGILLTLFMGLCELKSKKFNN